MILMPCLLNPVVYCLGNFVRVREGSITRSNSLGMKRTKEIYEMALNREDVQRDGGWISEISHFFKRLYPALRQSRIFCSLEKAVQLISKGTGPIWPFVFDVDPTKSLFKIEQVHLEDVKTIVMRVTIAEPPMPEAM